MNIFFVGQLFIIAFVCHWLSGVIAAITGLQTALILLFLSLIMSVAIVIRKSSRRSMGNMAAMGKDAFISDRMTDMIALLLFNCGVIGTHYLTLVLSSRSERPQSPMLVSVGFACLFMIYSCAILPLLLRVVSRTLVGRDRIPPNYK
jgi:hypothetical protein